MTTDGGPTEQQIRQLSGLRRAMYYTALSRKIDPSKAYRLASARCCEPSDGAEHTQACLASLTYGRP